MRDLSNRVAPYLLFDGELAITEREPVTLIERVLARTTGKKYYRRDISFFRTLHALSYRGEYNIGILYDRDGENAPEIWDNITDEEGLHVYRLIEGVPTDVDFLDFPIEHFFAAPSRASQARVGKPFTDVWSVLS